MNTLREQSFRVEIVGSHTLTVSEIWPDGDAPANPSAADVLARLREWSGTACLLNRLDYGETVFTTCQGEW